MSELNNEAQKSSAKAGALESDLPSPHYAWVESEHPYKPAGLWNYKVPSELIQIMTTLEIYSSRLCFRPQSAGCQ